MNRYGRGGGRFGILGVAAAACVACCAGPILAFLAGLTVASAAATVLVGVAGAAVAVAAATTFVIVRQRRPACTTQPMRRSRSPRQGSTPQEDDPSAAALRGRVATPYLGGDDDEEHLRVRSGSRDRDGLAFRRLLGVDRSRR